MEEEKEGEAAAMIDFREVYHPNEFLYQHETTGKIYRLVGFDGDIPILQPVNPIVRDSTPLLEAPQPVLRIPERVQSGPRSKPVDGYHSGMTVEGEVLSEEIVQGSPIAIEAIKRLPIEGKLLLLPALLILLFFGLAVPIMPKIVKTIQQTSVPAPVATGKATDRLTRISQLDQGQYDAGQYDAYSQSACSAASLTAAFNSWGGTYKIGIVLDSEISEGVISPSAGLTDLSGIAKTANRFGFDAQAVSGLDQAISTASAGTPVIADIMPGSAWPGGHFLVVVGGDDQNVKLADSWSTNFQTISRSRFVSWGLGQMWSVSPSQYSVLRSPTVSADQINAMLTRYHSPLVGQGQLLVDLGIKYHVDPAYAVATFGNESTFGTEGVAVNSFSLGNLRCPIPDWTGGQCKGGYEHFQSWQKGVEVFYELISGSHYSGAGNNTPEMIIPKYAPSSDNNSPSSYIANVKHIEDVLRAGKTQI
jgi:hypothetical protein